MPPYFKPLRRKIGLLTLLLACVCMVEWMRSHLVSDRIRFSPNGSPVYRITSHIDQIAFEELEWKASPGELKFESWKASRVTELFDNELEIYWNRLGFSSGGHKKMQDKLFTIPYWSIVVPPTLLSAWLLLSKPPAKTPTVPVR